MGHLWLKPGGRRSRPVRCPLCLPLGPPADGLLSGKVALILDNCTVLAPLARSTCLRTCQRSASGEFGVEDLPQGACVAMRREGASLGTVATVNAGANI